MRPRGPGLGLARRPCGSPIPVAADLGRAACWKVSGCAHVGGTEVGSDRDQRGRQPRLNRVYAPNGSPPERHVHSRGR